jgi:ABC-2 type transport system permease protein
MADTDTPKSSFSKGRRWLNWLNDLLAVIAVLAMVIMVNYISSGHFRRVQVDRETAFALSPQTLRILDGLTNDVHITKFFRPHGANEEIYDLTSSLLTEYEKACPRHIQVHTLDYDRNVGEAKEFLAKYSLNGLTEKDFVFFECNGNTKIADAKELADYDFSQLLSGQSKFVRRSAFLGEKFFTEDIYDVSNPHALKAYFLYGHGENDPEEAKADTGYSKLAGVLKDEINCDWQKLSLEGTNTVPADCQLLIVPASAHESKMLPDELAKIGAYLKRGGRMLALLTMRSGLESVLSGWGVELGDNRVWEQDKDFALSDKTFLTAVLFDHPIMNPLASEKKRIFMVYPRPVTTNEATSQKIPGAPQVTRLAETSPYGIDDDKHAGAFPLMVAVEQGDIPGVNSPGGRGTRMVVVGDSDFLDNQVIDSVGNHDFAHLALTWLLQRPQIMLQGLQPHPIKEYKLYMTGSQARAIRWLFLAGMPGVVLLLGGLVWLRRRS